MDTTELNQKVDEWKRQAKPTIAKIIGNDKSMPAELYVYEWSGRQRKFRFIKSLATCWGLALLSLFIPIVHFFAVPLFFLAGLIIPFSAFSTKSFVMGGIGTCPYCMKPFEVAKARDKWPLNDICESCHRHVSIERS